MHIYTCYLYENCHYYFCRLKLHALTSDLVVLRVMITSIALKSKFLISVYLMTKDSENIITQL